MRRSLLIAPLLALALAGCGGGAGGGGGGSAGGASTPATAPGMAGLERSVDAARGVVSQSQQDAQRASAASAGQ